MASPTKHGLSPKQKLFADIYLEGNIAAGVAYTRAGYSQNGAAEGGSRLLKNPKVSAYMEAEQERLSEKSRIKKWQVLEFLSDVLTTPIGEIDEKSILAQEVTRDEIGEESTRVKVKTMGHKDAIELMGKLLGWFAPQKIEVSGAEELASILANLRNVPVPRE